MSEWEYAEAYREFKKEGQERAAERAKTTFEILTKFAKHFSLEFEVISPYCCRISEIVGNKKIDVFPRKKKYHMITTNKRGDYNKLQSFINHLRNYFKIYKPYALSYYNAIPKTKK